MSHADATAVLREVARGHDNEDVQREAIKGLADWAPDKATVDLLESVVRTGSPGVRREALEALGGIDDGYARERLSVLLREHDDPEIRMEAVEALVESVTSEQAVAHLKQVVSTDPSRDVQEEALESLVELPGGVGVDAVLEIARAHPNAALRRKALELLLESDDPRARAVFERALATP